MRCPSRRQTRVGSQWQLCAVLAASHSRPRCCRCSSAARSGGPTFGFGGPELAPIVLNEIRLPRTLLALLVGGTLGLCGAALQGLLRNPLAEPGIARRIERRGVRRRARVLFRARRRRLAHAAGRRRRWARSRHSATLYALARRRGDFLTIVLAGIAINAFTAALTSLALNFAPSPYAALEILFWMLGSLADRSLAHVALALPLMVPGWLLVIAAARGLDALTLGEETAASLGFDPRRTQWLVIGGTALAVGGAVAVTGVVGFVGLVVPHLLRGRVGHHPSRLLVPSFLGGAAARGARRYRDSADAARPRAQARRRDGTARRTVFPASHHAAARGRDGVTRGTR